MVGIDVEGVARFDVGSGDFRATAINRAVQKVRARTGRQGDGVAGRVASGGAAKRIFDITAVNVAVDGGVVRYGDAVSVRRAISPHMTAIDIIIDHTTRYRRGIAVRRAISPHITAIDIIIDRTTRYRRAVSGRGAISPHISAQDIIDRTTRYHRAVSGRGAISNHRNAIDIIGNLSIARYRRAVAGRVAISIHITAKDSPANLCIARYRRGIAGDSAIGHLATFDTVRNRSARYRHTVSGCRSGSFQPAAINLIADCSACHRDPVVFHRSGIRITADGIVRHIAVDRDGIARRGIVTIVASFRYIVLPTAVGSHHDRGGSERQTDQQRQQPLAP